MVVMMTRVAACSHGALPGPPPLAQPFPRLPGAPNLFLDFQARDTAIVSRRY
jgi:hypothetical protein